MQVVPLTTYQKRWVNDKSRFKIGVFTRQGGKSFASSLEAVIDCYERKTSWVFLSAGERQSKELISKAKMHAKSIHLAIESMSTELIIGNNTYKQLEIKFPNGSRIVGLPANPETAVGWSANILLDEFSKHKASYEIWKAMFPTVTRGYKVRVVSTYSGRKNKFYELFHSTPTLCRFNGAESEYMGEEGGWSKHFVDIHQAVAMGLELKDPDGKPCDIEVLRKALSDEDVWQEDYLCIALEENTSFITNDIISECQNHTLLNPKWVDELIRKAMATYDEKKLNQEIPKIEMAEGKELYMGYDIARSRDFSVIWIDEKSMNVRRAYAIISMKKFPFTVQEMILFSLLNTGKIKRACLDAGLFGANITEKAQGIYGADVVEGIHFSNKVKESLAYAVRHSMEDRQTEIPVDEVVRHSFRSIKKYTTSANYVRFDAERTEKSGHGDHFWAKALALHASESKESGPVGYESGKKRRWRNFFGAI
jgi:phage FluMu gp28-like protein